MMLIGVPWLAFFVVRALPQIGQVSLYSVDDWLTYQVAGYRIYMNGFWLEGGNQVFDYQPLYRWITGALHLVFGDSSVGEVYWDAACLLAGGLVAFTLVEADWRFSLGHRRGGGDAGDLHRRHDLVFRRQGTVGDRGRRVRVLRRAGDHARRRAAGGRRRRGDPGRADVLRPPEPAAVRAVPGRVVAAADVPAQPGGAWRGRSPRSIPGLSVIYLAMFAIGVALFALRTWWYSGVFSLLYGTSLKNNDTGLRLSTVGSVASWKRIAHSLSALVWMNEPPRSRCARAPGRRRRAAVRARASPGAALSDLPASIAIVTVGAARQLVHRAHPRLSRTHVHPPGSVRGGDDDRGDPIRDGVSVRWPRRSGEAAAPHPHDDRRTALAMLALFAAAARR